jgi:hypothetical protein
MVTLQAKCSITGINVSRARVINAVDNIAKNRNVKKDIILIRIAQADNTRSIGTAGLFSTACQHPSISPAIGRSHIARPKVHLCDVVPIADSPCILRCPCVDGADIRDVPSCAGTQPWRLLQLPVQLRCVSRAGGLPTRLRLPDF